MGTDYGLQFVLLFASFLTGLALGLIYDLFRISRMFFLKNRAVIFVEDILFCLICASAMTLLFYNYSFGRVRAFAFLGTVSGFCAYYFTAGRFTRMACEKVYAYASPKINRLAGKIKLFFHKRKKRIYTAARISLMKREAGRGFGLYKKAEIKNEKHAL